MTKSREIVDEIAFSKVSTLDVTKRVQRVINTNDIGRFKSSWPNNYVVQIAWIRQILSILIYISLYLLYEQ